MQRDLDVDEVDSGERLLSRTMERKIIGFAVDAAIWTDEQKPVMDEDIQFLDVAGEHGNPQAFFQLANVVHRQTAVGLTA